MLILNLHLSFPHLAKRLGGSLLGIEQENA